MRQTIIPLALAALLATGTVNAAAGRPVPIRSTVDDTAAGKVSKICVYHALHARGTNYPTVKWWAQITNAKTGKRGYWWPEDALSTAVAKAKQQDFAKLRCGGQSNR